MALAFVQKGSNGGVSHTLTGVGVGALLSVFVKWESAAGVTFTNVTDGAGHTFTTDPTVGVKTHANGDLASVFAYDLVAVGGSTIITAHFTGTPTFVRLYAYEFSYTGTVVFDRSAASASSGATVVSGNITTTGTDEVVLGGYGEYSAPLPTTLQINGVAADQTQFEGTNGVCWERKVSATFTGGSAITAFSGGTPGDWTCHVISFTTNSGGGGETITVDKWFRQAVERPRLAIGVVPSGTTGIKA